MEKAFNIKEIAEITGKSHTTIYRYIKKGKIPFFTLQKDGQTVFQVKQQDLETFLGCKIEDMKKGFKPHEIPPVKTINHDDKTVFQLTQESLQEAIFQAISQQQKQLMKPIEEQALYLVGELTNEVKHLKAEKETLRLEVEKLQEEKKALPDLEQYNKMQEENIIKERAIKEQAELHLKELEKLRTDLEKEKNEIAAAWEKRVKELERPWWKFW